MKKKEVLAGSGSGLTLRVFFNQVVSSSMSNMVGVLVGHPLDTIKVRLQLKKGAATQVIKATYYREGLQGFYKGFLSPFVAKVPFKTSIFVISGCTKKLMGNSTGLNEQQKNFIAGSLAGGLSQIIYNPMELLKCRA